MELLDICHIKSFSKKSDDLNWIFNIFEVDIFAVVVNQKMRSERRQHSEANGNGSEIELI